MDSLCTARRCRGSGAAYVIVLDILLFEDRRDNQMRLVLFQAAKRKMAEEDKQSGEF